MLNFFYTPNEDIINLIAAIEYNKAVMENTQLKQITIERLQKEFIAKKISNSLQQVNINENKKEIANALKGYKTKVGLKTQYLIRANKYIDILKTTKNIEFEEVLELKRIINNSDKVPHLRSRNYDSNKLERTKILANVTVYLEFLNNPAHNLHPLITASIASIYFLYIAPFEDDNVPIANLLASLYLVSNRYLDVDFIPVEAYVNFNSENKTRFMKTFHKDQDLTPAIVENLKGYLKAFTEVKEAFLEEARRQNISRYSKSLTLTDRQERIIDYTRQFGQIRNKDFDKLFPDLSEDTVLRELKDLINKGLIIKVGKTKSSYYELK